MAANFSHKDQLFTLYPPQSTQIKQSKALAQAAPALFFSGSQGAVLCFETARSGRASEICHCLDACLQWEKGEPMGCFAGLQSVGNWNKQDLHQFHVTGIFKSPKQLQLGLVGGSKEADP